MFAVDINGNKYRVTFSHQTDSEGRYTQCFIKDNDETTVYEGVAECNPNDNYVKSKGRKIALARALQTMNLDREVRENVWNKYFSRCPKK